MNVAGSVACEERDCVRNLGELARALKRDRRDLAVSLAELFDGDAAGVGESRLVCESAKPCRLKDAGSYTDDAYALLSERVSALTPFFVAAYTL